MTTVQHTLVAPDESPVSGAYIEARLRAPSTHASAYTDVGTEILDRVVTHSAADGTWSLELVPNSSITPANTFYEVVTRYGGFPAHYSAIIVPDDDDPVDLTDILVADPDALPAVQYLVSEGGDAGDVADDLAAHEADTTNVHGITNTANLETTSGAQTKANAAQAAAIAASQPVDSDLTAIAALTTTPFGRGLLSLANAAAGISALGLGTAATADADDFDPAGSATAAIAAVIDASPEALNTLNELAAALGDDANFATTITNALAGKQPLDSDLTAIAALTTTSYGRAFLALADAAAGRTALGLGTAAVEAASAFEAAGTVAAHINDTTDAHDASAISVVPFGSISATQLQAALEEIFNEATGGGGFDGSTDIFITGDDSIGTTPEETGVGIGVESNGNAHIEIVSDSDGVAYIDLTTPGNDTQARIGYNDDTGVFRVEMHSHNIQLDSSGNFTVDGSPVGGGDEAIPFWEEDVTYPVGSQVLANSTLWVAGVENINSPPGDNEDWGVGVGFPDGIFASDVGAEDTDHRPLTGGSVQEQLDRADSLLRFTNPGGALATFRGSYDPTENYYPGDAVQQFFRDTQSWFLYLCVDVPGDPEAGVVGEDLNGSDYWVGICQEGWAGAIDLRASGFNPLAGNTNNVFGFDHSNGPMIAGSYTVSFDYTFGSYEFSLNWDYANDEGSPLQNQLASQIFGNSEDWIIEQFYDAASWRVSMGGNLSGIPIEISVVDVSLIGAETLYFDTDAGPSGQKLYVEEADGSWTEIPDIQIGTDNPIGVNSGTEGDYYVYGDVGFFGWVYRSTGGTGWEVVGDTAPPSVGGSGPPTEPVYMTMSTASSEQSTRGGISAPIGSTLRLQREDGDVGTFWVKSGEADDIWTPMPVATQPYNFRGAFSPEYIEDQPYTFGDVITWYEEDNGQRLLLCKAPAVDSTPSPGESGEDDPNWEWLFYSSNPVIMQAGWYENTDQYPYNGDVIAKISMYANGGTEGEVTLHFIIGGVSASDTITIDVTDPASSVLSQIQPLFDFSVGLSEGIDEAVNMVSGYSFDFYSAGEPVVTVFESATIPDAVEPLLVVDQEGARTGIDAPLASILIIQNFNNTPTVLFHAGEEPEYWVPLDNEIAYGSGAPDDQDFVVPGTLYYDEEGEVFHALVDGGWRTLGGGGFDGDAYDIPANDSGHTYLTGDSIGEQLDQADARFVELGDDDVGGAGSPWRVNSVSADYEIPVADGLVTYNYVNVNVDGDVTLTLPDTAEFDGPEVMVITFGHVNGPSDVLTVEAQGTDVIYGWPAWLAAEGVLHEDTGAILLSTSGNVNQWKVLNYSTSFVPGMLLYAFADSTARDAAYPSPQDGLMVNTGGTLQVWANSAWNDLGGSSTEIWDIDTTYSEGAYVYANGGIWLNATSAAGEEPGVAGDWTLVLEGVGVEVMPDIPTRRITTGETIPVSDDGRLDDGFLIFSGDGGEDIDLILPNAEDCAKATELILRNERDDNINLTTTSDHNWPDTWTDLVIPPGYTVRMIPWDVGDFWFVTSVYANDILDGGGTVAAEDVSFDGTEASLSATDVQRAITDVSLSLDDCIALAIAAQPGDSDLTDIAALSPTNNDVLQRKAGAWTNRSIAQLLVDLGVVANPLATDTLWDAKGDIVVGTGSNTASKLAVGSFGQVPVVDSTTTTGLIYASPESLRDKYLKPTGSYETIPRQMGLADQALLASGRISLVAIALPKNFLVTSIAFHSLTTAASLPTHWWFSLCDNTYTTLRSTADQTTAPWGSNTQMIKNLSSTVTTAYEGLYYLAIMMTATTPISVAAATQNTAAVNSILPYPAISGTTGQTGAPSDGVLLAASPTAQNPMAYAYVI